MIHSTFALPLGRRAARQYAIKPHSRLILLCHILHSKESIILSGVVTIFRLWYNGYTTPQEDEIILNAEITKLLFKNKCTLAVKAYDILGQSKNLSVSDSANYHIETRNNTLGRYIILSLTTVLVTSVVQVADADREAQCVALWRPTVLEIDT